MKERIIVSLILIAVGIVIVKSVRSDTHSLVDIHHFWIEKTHDPAVYNLLICGDSRVYRGVSPKVVQTRLDAPFRAFNYGYSSGSYSSFMLDQIELKIDRETNQVVLLLGITPYSLTPMAAKDAQIREELNRKKEEIFEYRYLIPLKKWVEPFVLPSILEKTNTDTAKQYVNATYYQYYYEDEGWVASWKIPADSNAAISEYMRDFTQNRVDPALVDTLIQRVEKWTSGNFLVFAFRPPTTVEMIRLEDSISGFDKEIFIEKFEKAGGRWIEVAQRGFQSYDGSHLTRESAIKLSEVLADSLKKELLLHDAQ